MAHQVKTSPDFETALSRVREAIAASPMPDIYWRIWDDTQDPLLFQGEIDGWQYGKRQFLTMWGNAQAVADVLVAKLKEWSK